MVTKFEKYEKVNEGTKSILTELAIALTSLFSSIGTDVSHKSYDDEYFQKYVKNLNIANNNQLVQQAMKDFKQKISTDPKILNKQEIYNKLDSTPIVWRRNDDVCYALYQMARKQHPGVDPESWCYTISKTGSKKGGSSVIFLIPNAQYHSIIHELSHAIETVVEVDPKILDMFNFNYTFNQQNTLFKLLTDFEYELRKSIDRNVINYLNNPSEVYSRMNNLKMFLFKNKILKSVNGDITELTLMMLITGRIYKNLDEKNKELFRNSDFMDILMFIDIKKFPDINKYVQGFIKTNNLA